jgi:hypothetical protein
MKMQREIRSTTAIGGLSLSFVGFLQLDPSLLVYERLITVLVEDLARHDFPCVELFDDLLVFNVALEKGPKTQD